MEHFLDKTNYFFSNYFEPSSTLFMVFGGLSLIISIVLGLLWIYAFYDCLKYEKDKKTRNIWLAIIIAGKFLGALCYIFLERIVNKESLKKPNGEDLGQ
ncbi:MAG: PLDc N-terminal domain-containing protein [Elusimicrobiales bacterium]|nr:PLDc N-terminal domain-containing protein [Elusimicrobiales bacterium]